MVCRMSERGGLLQAPLRTGWAAVIFPAAFVFLVSWRILGQTPQPINNLPPVVHLTAEQDHQRLMDLLHIPALRRGPDGDPKSPNAANFDESKATTYTKLPDPLVLINGKRVTTSTDWWEKRRP